MPNIISKLQQANHKDIRSILFSTKQGLIGTRLVIIKIEFLIKLYLMIITLNSQMPEF